MKIFGSVTIVTEEDNESIEIFGEEFDIELVDSQTGSMGVSRGYRGTHSSDDFVVIVDIYESPPGSINSHDFNELSGCSIESDDLEFKSGDFGLETYS